MRIIHFAFLLCTFCLASCVLADDEAVGMESDTWSWFPEWRDKADCGPNALYVLMNLEGHRVTLEDVKALITLDPVYGCSMADLIDAAAKLGFTLEARFVKPSEIRHLPRPFILHGITSHYKNLGHFILVVDFDPQNGNFALIDPIRETFGWNPEASLLRGYSGYVLVPKYPLAWRWNLFAGITLFLCAIGCAILLYRSLSCPKPPKTSQHPRTDSFSEQSS